MSSRAFQLRCLLLCSVLVTGLSLLSVRLIQIQIWDRKKYAERARAAYDRSEILPGFRGKIVDRHDEVLAKSIALSTVMVDAKLLEDPVVVVRALAYREASTEDDWAGLDEAARERKLKAYRSMILEEEDPEIIVARHLDQVVRTLARPLGLRTVDLRERIEEPMSRGRLYFAIAKDLPEDDADRLRRLIAENHLKGLRFENSIRRWYTSPELATHVIGYTGEAEVEGPKGKPVFRQVGKFGVEAAMEEYLRGQDGVWDHLKLPMPGEEGSMVPPVHGLNVRLTLDMGIQAIVEEELDAGLKEFISGRGCVVVLDPDNGELLAMVNRPHFNLNFKKGLEQGAMNYALQGIYEPGSTFKVIGVAGALNEGLVSPLTLIDCEWGHYVEGSLRIPDHHPYGMLSVSDVLKKSSNIGAFKVARQLGTGRFFRYAEDFGFGEETGILLSGESAGIVRNTNNLVDFSRASYGYALNVTPLQVAAGYSVIANGGEWIRPRVVRSIVASDGTVIERFKPEVERRVIKESVAEQLREALTTVTEEGGTATRAAVPGFKVAGKTGTAIRIVDGHYQHGHYTVSFAGMMPAQDPRFVCLVVVDDPLTEEVSRFGGTVAAPIFSKIAGRIATHLNLTPTEPLEEDDEESSLAGTHEP
ncbi:peptidoglycan D,D-transpeptidase FtsI family protein [Haloferula sp. A504]|uniref:peptidoglycan D,D-transpeptidase FtsI family protein n=1 Tax=Haloferula sp. A504 TaxID=3373601 RepID=UPI0031C234EC|nr:penicillin-binding protein 2 [Verrucomicrobiaceae bacterium E54]